MKKLCLVLTLTPLITLGAKKNEVVDGVTWYYESYTYSEPGTLTGTTVLKTGARIVWGSYSGVRTIPSSLGGYPVKQIGDGAFRGCSGLTSVGIPSSVISIGDSAFYNCSGLTAVTLPTTVTNIGASAFAYCGKLSSVTIPAKVARIESSLFYDCTGLTSVTISSGVQSVGEKAFYGCKGLSWVKIPSTVKYIGDQAFCDCSGLKSVTISSDATSAARNAFSGCTGLADAKGFVVVGNVLYEYLGDDPIVSIPNGVKTIASSVFFGRADLTSVTMGTSVSDIGEYAFHGCAGLNSVTFGRYSEVKNIGRAAFYGCIGLTSINIPAVTCIEGETFAGCTGLKSVTIPSSVTNIANYAFSACRGMSSLLFATNTSSITYGGGVTETFISPPHVKRIGEGAFFRCSALTEVTLPSSVETICDEAFEECSGLKSVILPSSVTSIGYGVFKKCSSLTNMSLPFVGAKRGNSGTDDSLFEYVFGWSEYAGGVPASLRTVEITDETRIGNGAFSGCSGLVSVSIPSATTDIGARAFYNCSGLQSISILSSETKIGKEAFLGCSGLISVSIPACVESLVVTFPDAYKGLKNVSICDGVTSIREMAFYHQDGLESVKIPDSVTSIGDWAFTACGGLTAITIPAGVTSIGRKAFCDCSGLSSIVLPSTLTSIGDSAFEICTGLKFVMIPSSVKSIGLYAFAGCSGLSGIDVDSHNAYFTSLDGVLFDKSKTTLFACPGARETPYKIPSGVTSIGAGAFSGCKALPSVTIPSSVLSIEANAFESCSSLSSVWFENLLAPNVNDSAFYDALGSCVAYVKRNSTGWGVEIPGMWKRINIEYGTYTVTFDGQGGTPSVETVIVDMEDPFGELPIATRSGYAFDGWYTAREGGEKVLASDIPTGETTLYAHWTIIRYAITYSELHGAENPNPAQYTVEDAVCFDAIGNLPGRRFVGWSPANIPLGSVGDVSVMALWQDVGVNDVLGEAASTGGNANWFVSWKDANPILQSGVIVKKQSSWMEMSFEDAARVSFEWKASCEDLGGASERTDGMTVEIDGVEAGFICGETGWIAATNLVSGEGAHKIRWTYSKDAKTDVGEDCAWVRNVTVMPLRSVSFDVRGAEEGVAPEAIFAYVGDRYVLPDNGTLKKAKHTFVGWQFGDDVLVAGTRCVMPTNDVIYTAVWSAKVLDAPCITAPVVYDEESALVSISVSEGATIYYTLDGSVPSAKNGTRYAGAFRVTGTTKVSAVAVLDDWYDSEVAQVMTTRSWTTLEDSLGVDDEEFAITTGGAANWIGDKANACVKSTGDGWLKAVFLGPCVVAWEERAGTSDWSAKRQVLAEDEVGEITWEGASLSVRGLRRLAVRRVDFAGGEGASGEAPQGASPASIYDAAGFSYELPSVDGLSMPKHRFAGWKLGEMVFAVGTQCVMPSYDVMYVGVWEAKELSAPVIDVAAQYNTEKTTFSVNQQEGANVYYTLDGSDPSSEHGLLYTGVVEIEGSVTIRAVAALDDWFESEVVTASTIRLPWTASECLNATDFVFEFGGDAEWKRDLQESHDGAASLRSGTIGNYQTSEIRTTVTGPGELSFWYKASSECDEIDGEPYDGLMVYIDDVVQGDLMGGNIQWANVCLKVSGEGDHTVRWVYEKDKSGSGGKDCVWLDEVDWWPLVDPTSPVITSVSMDDTMNVKVSWGKVYGAKSYNVYRSTDNVKPSLASATGIKTNFYFDNDATPGVTYFYWVEAVNSVGRAISESASGYRAVALSVASESRCVSATPGTSFISVEANTSWMATSPTSWVTLKAPSGNLSGTFAYSVSGNTEKAQRSGTILITAGGETSHPKTIEISITQEEGPFEVLPDGGPYKFKIDEVEWRFYIKDGEATVGGGGNELAGLAVDVGSAGEIVIPDFLGGCPVRYIGKYAFYGCDKLTSVMIPSGVTDIGVNAFKGCTGLTSVTIPGCVVMSTVFPSAYSKIEKIVLYDGVTSIADGAFSGCRSLTSFTIPGRVTHIGERAFFCCYGLSSITIPSGVTYIGDIAFFECEGLTSITIPSSVEHIGERAFAGCSGLTNLTISEGVKGVGEYAFSTCERLTNISIPSSMENISVGAFWRCSGLTSLTIPEGVSSISDHTFSGCSKLESVTIPSSLTNMGYLAFGNCVGLTSVTISEGATCIGRYGFYGCQGLTSIVIPPSVVSIGGNAFCGCNCLKSVVIPSSVTSVGESAFEDCSGLTSLTISGGVKSIGDDAFRGCTGLTSVAIPSSVERVGMYAFARCGGLTSLTISEGVSSIDFYAFFGCTQLTALEIPSTVTNIDNRAFSGCDGLVEILVDTANPVYTSINGMLLTKDGALLVRGISGDVTIPSSVAKIGDSAFAGCNSLKSVMLPAGVTSIGSSAFSECSDLAAVAIPRSVMNIANYAFYGCTVLNVVIVGRGDVGRVKSLYAWPSTVEFVEVDTVSVEGDPGAMVIGDATTGFIIRPTMGNVAVEVSIPQGIDAAKVTVEVSPKVASVKPNGATVKVVNGGDDITDYLSMPAADGNGVVDLTKATVKDEFVEEAMDVEKGAVIKLDAANPSLTTPNTRKGLFYQLREGVTLEGMKDGDSTVGNGEPWSPKITVKGTNSAFYSIDVGKGE